MSTKAVLAFSGGLDTSFCVPYLKERGYDVVTVFVNTGGFSSEEARAIGARARKLGALRHYDTDAQEEIYGQIVGPLIRANGLYQDAYPNMCADRYVIVQKCVEIARREKTDVIAHGCTGMGNDQVRFDVSIRALGDFEIVAPIRDFQKTQRTGLREKEAGYLQSKGFGVAAAHRRYSINQNVLGVTISGSEIDQQKEPAEEAFTLTRSPEKAPAKPERIRFGFERGLPVSLNGRRSRGIEILRKLNILAGIHGVGRHIYTGDCIIGIKGRIAFECPGLESLVVAHRALEEATLSKEQNQFKAVIGKKWAELVYTGLYYDPLLRDLERFLESSQARVGGEVTLRLHRGTCIPVALSSPNRVEASGTVYAQASAWDPAEAEAFCKLFGLATTTAARRNRT